MANWTLQEVGKVLIGVVITAVMSGFGYVAYNAMQVPSIQETLVKTNQQLVAIRVGIFKLREGKPFDANDLKDLLSAIEDFSGANSRIIERITIKDGKRPELTPLLNLASSTMHETQETYAEGEYPVKDSNDIKRFIESTLVSESPMEWYLDSDSEQLSLSYPGGTAAVKLKNKLTIDELDTLTARLNTFREMVITVTQKVAKHKPVIR